MTEERADSTHSGGSYDNAIVAIAINDESDLNVDGQDDDVAFDDIVTMSISASEIDDADIDYEETWLRRCTGDLPDAIVTNPESFSSLPQEVQMKLLLHLREREKATLLESLRHNRSLVESLKAQLCESESKRLELEDAIDIENFEVEEMRRQFEEMKEVHKCRIEEIERITKQMIAQRERLSTIIANQQRSDSDSPMELSSATDCSPQGETGEEYLKNMIDEQDKNPTVSGEKYTSEIKKSTMEIEIEHKIQTNPQYREEFERFKEFQSYFQASTSNHRHQTNADASGSSGTSSMDRTKILSLSEEYRKLLEFQLMYERMLSSATKKNI